MQFSLGWNRAGGQTSASISSSRLQDRNFTGTVYNCAFILKGFGRCCVRERHAPSLQAPARLQAGGTRFSAAPSPDHRSILPDRPENFPAFRHECKDDARALFGSALTSGVQGSSLGADKSGSFCFRFGFFVAEVGKVGFGLGHGITPLLFLTHIWLLFLLRGLPNAIFL